MLNRDFTGRANFAVALGGNLKTMPKNVLVGFGSNMGDKAGFITAAWEKIDEIPGVSAFLISEYYETNPVGGPDGQEKYLNAAGFLFTYLFPEELLDIFQEIEAELGRVRVEKWGPRTIDIDILLYGTEEISTERLVIPHPRLAERRFVLEPAAEIAPTFPIGKSEKTIADLLYELGG